MKVLGAVAAVIFVIGLMFVGGTVLWGVGKYNTLTASDQLVNAKWGQVQNVYQRRSDLVPNIVEAVKGYAAHEHDTFKEVTEARASASQIKIDPTKMTPQQLVAFDQAQGQFAQALGKLMVVMEKYPELKANENFLQLQNQLEGTENRIAVERREFNLAAQSYNTMIKQFPGNLIARNFGFLPRAYFEAAAGADKAPKISFDKAK